MSIGIIKGSYHTSMRFDDFSLVFTEQILVLFAIMAIVPIIVIVLLSNFFLTSLDTRSQAVQTSVDSQSLSSQEQSNLQRMHALLQTRFNQTFASLSGVIVDPALVSAGGLVSTDITAL